MKLLAVFCVVVVVGAVYCTECHDNNPGNYCHGLTCLDADTMVGCIDNMCTCVQGPRKCATSMDCADYECKDHGHRAHCGHAGYCVCSG